MTWIGLLAVLALPGPAGAENVPLAAGQPRLAVAQDGTPYVAEVFAEDLYVAHRTPDGWALERPGRLPSNQAAVAGLVVGRAGVWTALVEADNGAWLALARRGSKPRVVARRPKNGSFGPAGLTLDAAGRPAFAYAVAFRGGKTWLRLVTTDARGRLHTQGITKGGFPSSALVPGAAPVLVRRRLHVVETYTDAAIDWGPRPRGGWEGQFLFASRSGSPAGRVGAAASGTTLWTCWTEMTTESLMVLLTTSAQTQDTFTAVEHGIFVSLLLAGGRPEVGAYDWVQLAENSFVYAGVLADDSGPFTELDGRLESYALAPGGGRQLLLSTPTGLEWFESAGRPSIRVSLDREATGFVHGRVDGATGGDVQIYRETASGRTKVADVQLAPDGSFAFQDAAPTSPTLYRAVYADPATGIPYASLLRTPIG